MIMKTGFFVGLMVLLLLAACTQAAATPDPGVDSDEETSILEEGGNINLALREAQKGRGPSIIGDPTAVYGMIMTYSAAVKAAGSKAVDGESQAWKFDRLVYLYLFEGDIFDPDPRTRNTTDWAQKVVILDAETGAPFSEITHRVITKLDVSQFLPLTIRDNTKGVPPREIKSLNRPPPIPVARATPAPKPPDETPIPTPLPLPPVESSLTIFFPQQEPVEGERVVMTALIFGELRLVDGCLRVGSGPGHLLVWPPGFSLSTENDGVEILNGAGQVVARVGEEVHMGGGEVPFIEEAARTRLKIPADCPGRYWIVGKVREPK